MRGKIFTFFFTFFWLLLFSLVLTACGNSQKPENIKSESESSASSNKEQTSNNPASNQASTPDSSVDTAQAKQPEPADKATTESSESDSENEAADALQGLDRIKAIITKRPARLRIASEMTAFNMTTKMTVYYDGNKSRTEITAPDLPKSILIHLPDEETMYQYIDGESTGVKMTGADQGQAEEMGMMIDSSVFTNLINNTPADVIARTDYLEELNGEKVIYIESNQTDEEVGQVLVKMWYSEKYATPLKYEIYVGETSMSKFIVKEISDNANFNADSFLPPADIQFQEIDMDAMMESW